MEAPAAPIASAPLTIRLANVIASNGLAAALFVGLLVLTYAGTLDQVERGVLHAQQKYFHSFVFYATAGPVSLPLPGAQTLLGLLVLNLCSGGIVRLRRSPKHLGTLLIHLGILVLLLGGFITHYFGQRGEIRLTEGAVLDAYQSDDEWVLQAQASNSGEAAVNIDLRELDSTPNSVAGLPFTLRLREFATSPATVLHLEVDSLPQSLLLKPDAPAIVSTRAGDWRFTLTPRRWPLPFSLRLDSFTREVHPNSEIPRAFSSSVTTWIDGAEFPARIELNQPLRLLGHTLYLSTWGPQGNGTAEAPYVVIAVARDAGERFPLYACAVIVLGMLLHFGRSLLRYLRSAPWAATL